MTEKLRQAILAVQQLPEDRQNEIADLLLFHAMPSIDYNADQLSQIDEGKAQVDHGEFASKGEVASLLQKQ